MGCTGASVRTQLCLWPPSFLQCRLLEDLQSISKDLEGFDFLAICYCRVLGMERDRAGKKTMGGRGRTDVPCGFEGHVHGGGGLGVWGTSLVRVSIYLRKQAQYP